MLLSKSLHKLASPILYYSGQYQKAWRQRARRRAFSFALFYHRVLADDFRGDDYFAIERGIRASDFEKQMRFLLRHFTPVRASRIQADLDENPRFAVTLDDGYLDNYEIAAPILKKLGIPAAFYVVSDYVGTDRLFWWEQVAELMRHSDRTQLNLQDLVPGEYSEGDDSVVLPIGNRAEREYAYEQLCSRIRAGRHIDIPQNLDRVADYFGSPVRKQGRRYGLMNWQQLRDLIDQGFEIGCHTATHCNVVSADEALLERELVESVKIIEGSLDSPVESFAYPYGHYTVSSEMIDRLLAKTNCKVAFTAEKAVVTADLPATELPRTLLNRAYHFACAFNLQDTLINTDRAG